VRGAWAADGRNRVGFKYIAAEMIKGDVLLGFEESGGIGFPDHIPETRRDTRRMMLLELLATERKPVNRLIAELKSLGSLRRIDTHFPLEKRPLLMDFCKSNHRRPAGFTGVKCEVVRWGKIHRD